MSLPISSSDAGATIPPPTTQALGPGQKGQKPSKNCQCCGIIIQISFLLKLMIIYLVIAVEKNSSNIAIITEYVSERAKKQSAAAISEVYPDSTRTLMKKKHDGQL